MQNEMAIIAKIYMPSEFCPLLLPFGPVDLPYNAVLTVQEALKQGCAECM